MNKNETLERIKVKMKERNPSIKDVEFVAKRDPINFGATTYSVFINGEKSQDRLLDELICSNKRKKNRCSRRTCCIIM